MIRRDGQSQFVDDLIVTKRGNAFLKKATKDKPGASSKEDVKNLLNKFDKSKDIPDEYIKEHHERLEKGHDPKEVTKDFFKGLQKAKESKKKLSIRTAKLFRQCGIFKIAEKSVYQDLDSGDFWKISDDGKYVVRLFKESEGVVKSKE